MDVCIYGVQTTGMFASREGGRKFSRVVAGDGPPAAGRGSTAEVLCSRARLHRPVCLVVGDDTGARPARLPWNAAVAPASHRGSPDLIPG